MIIIQRKSDGKYFKDNTAWYEPELFWTDDIERARVFTGEAKARHYNTRFAQHVRDTIYKGNARWQTPFEIQRQQAELEMDEAYQFIPVKINKVVKLK